MAKRSIVQALNDALVVAMSDDETVFVMGEDIGSYGGVFGVTRGLLERFGRARVIDTPISEAGFVGFATGSALGGLRPVVEIMFGDFTFVAADQLINQAAKAATLWVRPVPLTVRIQQGPQPGSGPQHSQSVEALLAHYPGFDVVAPSTPADAGGLLLSAIASERPTAFLEHRRIYGRSGDVEGGPTPVPLGSAAIRRAGRDVSVVAYSAAVYDALDAADTLASEGIDAEVVDLRSIVPLDWDTVLESVSRTGAAVIAHEDHGFCGVGAEILARVAEQLPPRAGTPHRVGRAVPPHEPSPVKLEQWEAWRVDAARIVAAVREVLR